MMTWIWWIKSIDLLWNTVGNTIRLTLYHIKLFRANYWGDRWSKRWDLHNRFPPRKNRALNCLVTWACTAHAMSLNCPTKFWTAYLQDWPARLWRLNCLPVKVELPAMLWLNCLPYQSIKDTDGIIFKILNYCPPVLEWRAPNDFPAISKWYNSHNVNDIPLERCQQGASFLYLTFVPNLYGLKIILEVLKSYFWGSYRDDDLNFMG
jgi:hypothetical protein